MKKFIAVIFAFCCLSIMVKGQNVNDSYSMYGYGLLSDRATSMQREMGSVGFAMNSGRQINVMNPASYASIDSLTFLFDVGADITFLWQKQKSTKEHTIGGGLDYITMQFPICKYMGASIGLIPYSSVGYAFGTDIQHGAMSNQGSGGINQAYIGVAGNYKGIALGANVSYSFGNIVNDVFSTQPNTAQTLTEHVMQIRDWDIYLGLQYTARLSLTERMTVGATFAPKKSLHGDTWLTIQETTHESLPDTIAYSKLKGKYETPMSIGAGISYKHERASRWMVEADFTFQQWSKVKYSALYSLDDPENMVFTGLQFKNRVRYALGGEFVPKVRGNYFQRIAYRAGLYYNNDYLDILGNQVKEYGITCGLGFHTPEGKTMINLGFEWKHRTTRPDVLISQNYFNITLGVNFNELWFWQRKIK